MSYKKYSDLGKPDNKTPQPAVQKQKEIKPSNTTEHFVNPKKKAKAIVHLESKEHLNKLLKKHRIIVVDTWANWCGPCKHVAPKFEDLARQHVKNKEILFVKDDIDNDDSPHRNDVNAIPTFFFYFEGGHQEKLKYTGADIVNVERNVNKLIDFCKKNRK